ncbi:hypothetical protein KHQ81_12505 [Mycoplasmatota bacterium]|nr:hypothetical protein KHQ81_12505 [Mycoplasmatota bacterium]
MLIGSQLDEKKFGLSSETTVVYFMHYIWKGELWDRKKDGMLYPKKLFIYVMKNKSNSKVDKYLGIFTDLTKIKEEQKMQLS